MPDRSTDGPNGVPDQRTGGRGLVGHIDRIVQRGDGLLQAGAIFRMQLEDGLAPLDPIAGLRQTHDAGDRGNRILLARSPRTQPPRRDAHIKRVQTRDIA